MKFEIKSNSTTHTLADVSLFKTMFNNCGGKYGGLSSDIEFNPRTGTSSEYSPGGDLDKSSFANYLKLEALIAKLLIKELMLFF